MAALGGSPRSYDEIRDDYMERARAAGLVAKTLEKAAAVYWLHSVENQAFVSAASTYRNREHENLEYAGWMQVAILCNQAGFETGNGSVYDIEMAQKRWLDSTARAA